jgi:hypothetical protein
MVALTLVFGAAAATASAQSTLPVVRQLGASSAVTTDSIASVAAVRELSDGTVLVHDPTRARVLLLDRDMKLVRVVVDSTSGTGHAYGAKPGGLIPFRGDSTLFVDPATFTMHVIGPGGTIARTMAAPRASDLPSLAGGLVGNAGFDAQGRLVYRAPPVSAIIRPAEPGKPISIPAPKDSLALVHVSLATRKMDTIGFYRISKSKFQVDTEANGSVKGVTTIVHPLPTVDDWAILSDGTVALVRGQDFHVDFIMASGAVRKGARIPHDWQRLSDDDKVRISDSSRAAFQVLRTAKLEPSAGAGPPAGGSPPPGAVASGRASTGTTSPATKSHTADVIMTPITWPSAADMPDFIPAFPPGAARADLHGRLWIRTRSTGGATTGPVYDVIDGAGALVQRVQIPAGSTIAGFGHDGAVFLGVRDAEGALRLQRIVDHQ